MSIWLEAAPLVGIGTGVDLVHIPSFAEQLSMPGSTFMRVFTDREWARSHSSQPETVPNVGGPAHSSPLSSRVAASLAARWAAKEAAVKAWSCLISGQHPAIDEDVLEWSQIEVVHDRWNRPDLCFHGRVGIELDALARRLGARLSWSVSLSHDGDHAVAMSTVHALAVDKNADS